MYTYFIYTSCRALMDPYSDPALLCHSDPHSSGFQLCHRLVQQTLVCILQEADVHHMVEPPLQRLERDDAPVSRHNSWVTKPVDILQLAWRGDRLCGVNLTGVSPTCMGWRDATSALLHVEHDKSDKHACPESHTSLTSPPSAYRVFGHLALQRRTCLTEFFAGVSPMPTPPCEWLILGCIIGNPSPSCAV